MKKTKKKSQNKKHTRNQQMSLLKKSSNSYGGELLNTRKGRLSGRPLDTRNTMHLVLRSTQAVGEQSFKRPQHSRRIRLIIEKFSLKYGVQVLSLANVGNHLHFHMKITNRFGYYAFIRAVTSAIAMAVSGASRWNVAKNKKKFWDYRPFTRVVVGLRAFLTLKDYVAINILEGLGENRVNARFILASRPRQI